jgi:branched-chain amino acid transport system ATP-binding protein
LVSKLTITSIHAAYGAVRVIDDVTLNIGAGETVVLLGTNGNGKSTLMKCIMGIVRPSAGSIIAEIDGVHHDLVGRTTEQIVDLGIALVPEGRRLFPKLTVEENLLLGAFRRTARRELARNLEICFETFPRLAERRAQLAGSMSGGEQQMLALGRALMLAPKRQDRLRRPLHGRAQQQRFDQEILSGIVTAASPTTPASSPGLTR